MKRRPGGLGRGLDALFPTRPTPAPRPESPTAPAPDAPAAAAPPAAGAVELPVAAIAPNPMQPRTRIAPDELADLAASLRTHGVLQPLIVTRADAGYLLIAGERRWRAAQLAGLATVPAIVKDATPRERLELALVENVQRQDLTPLEEAGAYRQLISEHGLTQEAVATRVGKSRVAVANALRLLNLAPAVHAALGEGRISAGHARALLGAPDAAAQDALLARVLSEELSVRATEEAVRRGAAAPAVARTDNGAAPPAGAAGAGAALDAFPAGASDEPPGAPAAGLPATTDADAAAFPPSSTAEGLVGGPLVAAGAEAMAAAADAPGISVGAGAPAPSPNPAGAGQVVAASDPAPPGAEPSRPRARPTFPPGIGNARSEPVRQVAPDVAAVEQELAAALATKVQLFRSRRGGRLVIHYFSDDELQGLYERLTGRG